MITGDTRSSPTLADVERLEAWCAWYREQLSARKGPRWCKHCPFAEHSHDGNGSPAVCPGFEPR